MGSIVGQDAILGMDFMLPDDIRLDLIDGTLCLPDEVRIQLFGRSAIHGKQALHVKVRKIRGYAYR